MMKLILSFLLSFTVLAGAGTFPQGDHVKNLKDKIEFKNSKTQIISNDSDDPSAVAKFGDAGSLYLRTNGELWQKLDSGTTVNWAQLFITPLFTTANKLIKSDGLTDILDTGIDVIGTDALGNIDYLGMDIAVGAPAYTEGLLFYDDAANALSYYNDDSDVTVNLGQENLIRARNVTGADIEDGTPVFVSGSTGQTPNASLADSSFIETSITLGLWTSGTTGNNQFGYVTTFGTVSRLDTSSYAEGDVLYLDTTAGQLVNSPPRPPARLNVLGIVTNSHANQGKIFVRPESITRDTALYKNLITNFAGDAQFNPSLINFTSGDSAIFGDSGTITGTLATSTVAADQLLGTRVFKYTQAAGSLNDWIGFPQVTVPQIVNTKSVRLAYSFRYKYDGDGGDFEVRARCVDDNSIILSSSSTLDPTLYRFSGDFSVPKDCNEVIIGLHVLTENSGAILLFDDIKISDEPREVKAFTVSQSLNFSEAQNQMPSQSGELRFSAALTDSLFIGHDLLTIEDDPANTRTKFVALTNTQVVISFSGTLSNADWNIQIWKNGVEVGRSNEARVTGSTCEVSVPIYLNVGQYLTIRTGNSVTNSPDISVLNITATATSSGTVFASDTNKEDIVVEGRGATILPFSADVTDLNFTEVTDSTNSWNGTQFIVPESGVYAITGSYKSSANMTPLTNLFIGGVKTDLIGNTPTGNTSHPFSSTRYYNKNDVVSIRCNDNGTLAPTPLERHHINITKQSVNVDAVIVENFGNVVAASTLGTGELENVFSARIAGNSTIESDNQNFIQSVVTGGAGIYTVTFVPGFFSETPSLTGSCTDTSNGVVAIAENGTIGATIYLRTPNSTTLANQDFSLTATRQGADYKSKANYIDNLIIENPDGEFETTTKILSAGNFTNTVMTDLSVATIVGEKYLVTGALFQQIPSGHWQTVEFKDGTTIISSDYSNNTQAQVEQEKMTYSFEYTATSTAFTVTAATNGTAKVEGSGTRGGVTGSYIQLTKLPKKLGVDQLGQVVMNRTTNGAETLEKGQFLDGKQVYSRTWEVATDILADNLSFYTGISTNIEPIDSINYLADSWSIKEFTGTGGINTYAIYFDSSLGNISIVVTGTYSVKAGTTFTLKYTYP